MELEYAQEMLVHHEPPDEFLRFEPEYPGFNGYTDLVISCRREDDTGVSRVKAYIWEAKSPQCYIFEADTKHRVKPSKDLISAENQLLHYYYTNKGADNFRRHFSVVSEIDVCFGGIIIGQKSKLVKDSVRIRYSENERRSLYQDAIDYRREALWAHSGIRLLTWDRVLDFLRPSTLLPESSAITAGVVKGMVVDDVAVSDEDVT